jgi:hypothetical protein
MDEISFQIRNIIVQAFTRTIAASGIAVLIWPPTPLIW